MTHDTAPKPFRRPRELRSILAERFPKCFAPHGAIKRPLKIAIRKDLKTRCPDLTRKELHVALADYAGGYKYLTQVVYGAPRIDLDGEPSGIVTAEEEAHSRKQLAILQHKRGAYRKKWLVRNIAAQEKEAAEMNGVIERVAIALYDADMGHGAWNVAPVGRKNVARYAAQVAVMAMRDPTPAVIKAMSSSVNYGLCADEDYESDMRAAWVAAIDAALIKEPSHDR